MEIVQNNIDVGKYSPAERTASATQLNRTDEHRKSRRPKWRRPVFGYLAMLPLVAVTISIWQMRTGRIVLGAFVALALMLVAFLWGVWPAMVMLIVFLGCLDYVIASPRDWWFPVNWLDALQLVLGAMIGLLLIWITVQWEGARTRALAAEEELRVHAEKLETTIQMKDRFISVASHELKTPVTTIRVQAQFILRRLSKQKRTEIDEEFLIRSLQRIDEQTGRLTTLITDLLDTNKIPTDKVMLEKQPCDLNEICRKVIEDQRMLTGRSITLDAPALPIDLYVDPGRITQVLINVVSNAVKYSPKRSRVEVSIEREDKHALIRVRDYGHGIAKDDLPRIFETFYRTAEAQESCTSGFGLGLAITKEIVELHGGRIWCESELGQGSTFFVELPLDKEE
ncbi:MAG: HAMP domain-containing histidine kinase [Chloroflexi bacterium]|nr:HAMP domain-containing histidine kinase [Chloroflexota bacterium]